MDDLKERLEVLNATLEATKSATTSPNVITVIVEVIQDILKILGELNVIKSETNNGQ